MKTLTSLLFFTTILSAQVNKDLDNDGIKDNVTLDTIHSRIVCKLSTKKFAPIYSKELDAEGQNIGVRETKSGFEFYVSHMRAGYADQFKYDAKIKRIRLIGMSEYDFGPANNDESGTSSVNLLTNDFVGEMNEYDEKQEKLIAIPAIKAKMIFPKTYLEDFDGAIHDTFSEKSNALFNQRNNR